METADAVAVLPIGSLKVIVTFVPLSTSFWSLVGFVLTTVGGVVSVLDPVVNELLNWLAMFAPSALFAAVLIVIVYFVFTCKLPDGVKVMTVSPTLHAEAPVIEGAIDIAPSVALLSIALENVMESLTLSATPVVPFDGLVLTMVGGVGPPPLPVVNDKLKALCMPAPAWLLAAVLTVIVYDVLACISVPGSHVTIFVAPSQENVPEMDGDEDIAPSVGVLSITSENVIAMFVFMATFVALLVGLVLVTVGGVGPVPVPVVKLKI